MSAVIASAVGSESSGTSVTVAPPAGSVAGDILIVAVFADNAAVLSSTTTGWTQQGTIGADDGVMNLFSTNTVTTSIVVDTSGSNDLSSVSYRITGGDYGNIVWGLGYAAPGSSTDMIIPSIVIPEASCLEILVAGNDTNRAQTYPAAYTAVTGANNVGNNTIDSASRLAPSGATGTRTVTISTNRRNAAFSFAVPAATAGGNVEAIAVSGSSSNVGQTPLASATANVASIAASG